jgi:hypothetical protein
VGDHEQEPKRGFWARPVRVATLVLTTVVTSVIAGFIGAVVARYGLFDFLGERASVAQQLERIRHEEALQFRRVVFSERVDLHGNGELSYFLVFRHNNVPPHSGSLRSESDEIRIYDLATQGKLELKFRFEPSMKFPYNALYVFQPRSTRDVDGDGKRDVLGAWELFAMEPVEPVPTLIEWDDDTSKYVMFPLLNQPTTRGLGGLVQPLLLRPHGLYAHDVRHAYTKPVVLHDKATGTRLAGYAAEEFLLSSSRFSQHVLVAAYVVHQRFHASIATLQVLPWTFDLLGTAKIEYPCYDRQQRPLLFSPRTFPLLTPLRRIWHTKGQRFFC